MNCSDCINGGVCVYEDRFKQNADWSIGCKHYKHRLDNDTPARRNALRELSICPKCKKEFLKKSKTHTYCYRKCEDAARKAKSRARNKETK